MGRREGGGQSGTFLMSLLIRIPSFQAKGKRPCSLRMQHEAGVLQGRDREKTNRVGNPLFLLLQRIVGCPFMMH